jgi:hypothetical protein
MVKPNLVPTLLAAMTSWSLKQKVFDAGADGRERNRI